MISHTTSRLRIRLSVAMTALLLAGCGIKGGLYLPPNQLPNAKPPAGSEAAKAVRVPAEQTVPAAALRNPSADSPADMISDGADY
ncbi:MAG: LPS translocon maturation chaperone LptM [Fluviibacter sp.]